MLTRTQIGTNKYRDSPAAALLGQKFFFEPRLSGPIQTGTPQEGQLGAIGDTGKISSLAPEDAALAIAALGAWSWHEP